MRESHSESSRSKESETRDSVMTELTQKAASYEHFRKEWLAAFEDSTLSSIEKGRLFATKLITQWLDVTSEDEDFFLCDGSCDGGIDIAYLRRQDVDTVVQENNAIEGDTWYIVQSKYGTSFTGTDSIIKEGRKIVDTLQGTNSNLSGQSQRLLQKLNSFREKASDADRIVLVFATCDPINPEHRRALQDVKSIGRERGISRFDVEEVSLATIWRSLDDVVQTRLSVDIDGHFVEQSSGLLVGTVSLFDLFAFLNEFRDKTGDLDQLYEKNVRRFLGNRRKINKGIASTLRDNPEKFGLYNNGITIVVSGYFKHQNAETIKMNDPYIVNGCQTTRTIWDVLDSKLNSGGTGTSEAHDAWKEQVRRGGVVTKIVKSDNVELHNITRFTNSQNSVREQDFIALNSGFQQWARELASQRNIFLEIQRGGIESRKALEKRQIRTQAFDGYVNAFALIKVYGAGWLGAPGLAFGKNSPFLPTGSLYRQMISVEDVERPFGANDLYAAYILKRAADDIGFGRGAGHPSRHLSRYLFYHIIMRMLDNVIRLTPELQQHVPSRSMLTEAVLRLSDPTKKQKLDLLCKSALTVIEQYFSPNYDRSIHKEVSLLEVYNGNVNTFLKSENLGKKDFSPLLLELISLTNSGMALPTPTGGQTNLEFIASALIPSS